MNTGKKKVVILGCGRVGSMLSGELAELGHDVTIIDSKANSFRRVAGMPIKQVLGSGIDESVLKEAGLQDADAFIAVTNGDNTNIMSAQIATMQFGVRHAVARIYDPNRAKVYSEMGVATICTSLLGAGLLRDFVMDKPWGHVTDYIEPILADAGGQEEKSS